MMINSAPVVRQYLADGFYSTETFVWNTFGYDQ